MHVAGTAVCVICTVRSNHKMTGQVRGRVTGVADR